MGRIWHLPRCILLLLWSSSGGLCLPIAEQLQALNTRADEVSIGAFAGSVLLYSRGQRLFSLRLREDTLWNERRLQTLLADRSFLPRTVLQTLPPTVLGTWLTESRSAELALRRWSDTGWQAPEPLSLLNSPTWDGHPAVSPDGRWLVFASDRPGGWGGLDLYISQRLPDGRWGPPESLGAELNTAADEAMPWFLPDGRLLFASQGYTPNRQWKLVVAHRTPEGRWQREGLLPSPFTSDGDDTAPVVLGDTLVFASRRHGGRGGYDLYAFPLCGPVILHLQLPTLADGILTLQSDDGQQLQQQATPEMRIPTGAFRRITLRLQTRCFRQTELQLTTPCDFLHSVVYQVPLALPDTLPTFQFAFSLGDTLAYTLPTEEHAWSQVLLSSFELRSEPLSSEPLPVWRTPRVEATEATLEELVQILLRLLAQPDCFPRGGLSLEIIATAPAGIALPYEGAPLLVEGEELRPGTRLTGQLLAQLRAQSLAAELQQRLPPLPLLRWHIQSHQRSQAADLLVRIRPQPE